jgi:hypothetical protein
MEKTTEHAILLSSSGAHHGVQRRRAAGRWRRPERRLRCGDVLRVLWREHILVARDRDVAQERPRRAHRREQLLGAADKRLARERVVELLDVRAAIDREARGKQLAEHLHERTTSVCKHWSGVREVQ